MIFYEKIKYKNNKNNNKNKIIIIYEIILN